MERDLKLYITQLTTSKGVCERQIRNLGGENYQQDHFEEEYAKPDYARPIPFDTIMSNSKALSYFMAFLDNNGYRNLVEFWKDSNIDAAPSDDVHQHIKWIYSLYLKQGANRSIYPRKDHLHRLEEVLQDDLISALELLRLIRNSVYSELRERHYESFLYSQNFKEFMDDEAEGEEMSILLR